MLPELQQELTQILQEITDKLVPDNQAQIRLERPKQAEHGDIATNIAMQLARPAKRNPRELAQEICDAITKHPAAESFLATAEIAGPGFINFRLKPDTLWAVIKKIE